MNRTNDVNAVKQVMLQYEEGTRNRDVDLLQRVFHIDALMSGYLGGNLMVGPPQPFFDFVAANEVAPDYTSSIVEISVTGDIASAKVFEDNLFGMSFVNDFHLVKAEGEWSIVSKLFHHD